MILDIGDNMLSPILRGMILDFLYSVYPKAIDENVIIKLFVGRYKQDEIIRTLFYMADKGYIRVIHNKPIFDYQITPLGIDLLHGIIEDKGVFTKGFDIS